MKLKFKTVLSICLLLLPGSLAAQQKQGTPMRPLQQDYGMMKPTTIGTSKIRVKYAFQAQDLKDENTWIDCGQLLSDKGLTQYSSFFLAENDAALRDWVKKNANSRSYPNAIKLKGRLRDYWSEYQYSQIFVRGSELTEWAVMPLTASDNILARVYFDCPATRSLITSSTVVDCKPICGISPRRYRLRSS